MKRKNEAGFSLMETLVAIVILSGIVVPILASLMLSLRLNAKAEEVLKARIAVSSAVETLMAEGITGEDEDYAKDRFPGVRIITTAEAPAEDEETEEEETKILFYKVEAFDAEGLVEVTTYIRAAKGDAE